MAFLLIPKLEVCSILKKEQFIAYVKTKIDYVKHVHPGNEYYNWVSLDVLNFYLRE